MHERDLKKIFVTQDFAFQGLKVADRILVGLGQNISLLEREGLITVVPAHVRGRSSGDRSAQAAERMVADARWVAETSDMPFDESVVEARLAELKQLRASLCVESDEQRERLKRDAARAKAHYHLVKDERLSHTGC